MRARRARHSPSRFLVAYLRHKAQDRRWRAFLDVLDEVPVMPELQCYYYQAQLAVGDRREAYAGAASLWNVGYSQDDACDPLFKEWIRELGPDDELVWSRALKAFDAKNGHLIRYVKRFASRLCSEIWMNWRRCIGVHHVLKATIIESAIATPIFWLRV